MNAVTLTYVFTMAHGVSGALVTTYLLKQVRINKLSVILPAADTVFI